MSCQFYSSGYGKIKNKHKYYNKHQLSQYNVAYSVAIFLWQIESDNACKVHFIPNW